ncbi:MAG TPA: DUF6036 family nucleotidyltransferase [Vicinamibacterales bacterium]|jgi:hypothetical protein|nr:DUF6036 family nucleotidyltransferase [Vicinamibacterales bacterium]
MTEPWHSFLSELDSKVSTTLALHCLGGFAIHVTYGLPRPTADIDVCEVAPSNAKAEVVALAGLGSPLHKKHRVYLQIVTMASLPYNYEERLTEVFGRSFQRLRLLVLEPHDLALSKLGRNSDVDIEDVKYLGGTVPLDLDRLRARYFDEVRPYLIGPLGRGDTTINLWCEAIKEQRA